MKTPLDIQTYSKHPLDFTKPTRFPHPPQQSTVNIPTCSYNTLLLPPKGGAMCDFTVGTPKLTDFICVGTNNCCPATNELNRHLFVIMDSPHVFSPAQCQSIPAHNRSRGTTQRQLKCIQSCRSFLSDCTLHTAIYHVITILEEWIPMCYTPLGFTRLHRSNTASCD